MKAVDKTLCFDCRRDERVPRVDKTCCIKKPNSTTFDVWK